MSSRGVVLTLMCLGGLGWAAPQQPPPPLVFPTNRAVVGRNAKVWTLGGSSATLTAVGGAEVAVVSSRITIGPSPAFVLKLTPVTELAPGQYEISVDGASLSRFTVADEVDSTPPPAPVLTFTDAYGRIGAGPSGVRLYFESTNDFFIVVLAEGQSWEPTSESVLAADTAIGGFTTVFQLPPGDHRINAVFVDAAGNASEPVNVAATVPPDRACSVAPVLPLSLLALALLRRRFTRAAA